MISKLTKAFIVDSSYAPAVGLTPTINIKLIEEVSGSVVVTDPVSGDSMTDAGDGWYYHKFTDFDSTKEYSYDIDTTLTGSFKQIYGGNTVGDGVIDSMIQNGQFTSEALANAPRGGGGGTTTVERKMTKKQTEEITETIVKELAERNLEFDIDTSKLEKVAKKLEENTKKDLKGDKWLDNALESILTAVMNSKSEMLGKDDIKACFLSEIKKLPKPEVIETKVGYEIPKPYPVEKQVVVQTLDKETNGKLDVLMDKLGAVALLTVDKVKEPSIEEKRKALQDRGINATRLTTAQINRMYK